jgi:phosphoglycerate dehydrogenase-like enzyme
VNRLLILSADAPKYLELIEAANLPQLKIESACDADSAATQISDCNIILGNPYMVDKVVDSARQLEWVQSIWAGVNSLCVEGLRKDYLLTNVKDVFGTQMSEYIITYLFGLERQVFKIRNNQQEKRWQQLPYRHSRDIAVGIVGLGSIGRHIARVIRQFGIRVTGLSRSGKPCDDVEKVYTLDKIADFFEDPDYVVLVLPDTSATTDFINADRLSMMKSSAVLMNVGRGSTVNETDLVHALREGIIGGAVLDVFEQEPLAQDSPLWTLPNVFVTPHHSALSFPEDIVKIFIENYRRFLQQEPLLHVVDFELGY